MKIKDLAFLRDILKETKDNPEDPFTRLYTDAFIGLVGFGAEFDGEGIEIDGEFYPATAQIKQILERARKKPSNSKEPSREPRGFDRTALHKETVREKPKREQPMPRTEEVSADSEEPDVMPTPQAVTRPKATSGISDASKRRFIRQNTRVRIISTKDAADVQEFNFTSVPLTYEESRPAAPICVSYKEGEKEFIKVSPIGTGKRSIEVETGGFKFSVLGQFKKGRFSTNITPIHLDNEHKFETDSEVMSPEGMTDEEFDSVFTRQVGEAKVYVLPYDMANDATNRVKAAFVLETVDKRQAFIEEEGVYSRVIGGSEYRCYAKWEGNELVIRLEKV